MARQRKVNLKVRTEGLREAQSALRAAEDRLPGDLHTALSGISHFIVQETKRRLRRKYKLGRPPRSGAMERGLKARVSRKRGRLKVSYGNEPYVGWWEFGGTVHIPSQNRKIKRPVIREGRALYPAYFENRRKIESQIDDVADKVLQRIGQ